MLRALLAPEYTRCPFATLSEVIRLLESMQTSWDAASGLYPGWTSSSLRIDHSFGNPFFTLS